MALSGIILKSRTVIKNCGFQSYSKTLNTLRSICQSPIIKYVYKYANVTI